MYVSMARQWSPASTHDDTQCVGAVLTLSFVAARVLQQRVSPERTRLRWSHYSSGQQSSEGPFAARHGTRSWSRQACWVGTPVRV